MAPNLITLDRLLDYSELAEYLGVSPHTLRVWVSQKRIPYTKLGSRVVFTPKQVEQILESGKHEPVTRSGGAR
jgi:excisionase family DNA binding protein